MKTAIVTGGSRGLGKNMALRIAAKGQDVLLTYNSNEDEAQKVVAAIENSGRKAAALQLNVSQSHTFDAFAEQVRGVLRDWTAIPSTFWSTTRASACTRRSWKPPKNSSTRWSLSTSKACFF